MSEVEATSPDEFMRAAIRLSLESLDEGGGPFGAVVVRDGVIVGRGKNCVTRSFDPTAHAEVVAIRQACRNLRTFQLAGCELFASCEPCPMCLGAALWARLDRVWYGNTRDDAAAIGFDDRRFYEEFAIPPGERRLVIQPLLPDEAQAAFVAWERSAGKTPY